MRPLFPHAIVLVVAELRTREPRDEHEVEDVGLSWVHPRTEDKRVRMGDVAGHVHAVVQERECMKCQI